MQHTQAQVRFEGIEVRIGMKKLMTFSSSEIGVALEALQDCRKDDIAKQDLTLRDY